MAIKRNVQPFARSQFISPFIHAVRRGVHESVRPFSGHCVGRVALTVDKSNSIWLSDEPDPRRKLVEAVVFGRSEHGLTTATIILDQNFSAIVTSENGGHSQEMESPSNAIQLSAGWHTNYGLGGELDDRSAYGVIDQTPERVTTIDRQLLAVLGRMTLIR